MQLQQIRQQIDQLDNQLVVLYCQRLALVQQVAAAKAETGINVDDPVREQQVLYRLTKDLPDQQKLYVQQVYNAIFTTSKACQSALLSQSSEAAERLRAIAGGERPAFPVSATVACQGVLGSNSYSAATRLFSICDTTFFKTFEGVFGAVDKGLCRYGVLPIENSTAGSVNEVYDLLRQHHCYIVRAIRLPIDHCLAAPKGVEANQIRTVISHPQALQQCAVFLKRLGVDTRPAENTATAARALSLDSDGHTAVLCSAQCAELYGLAVLQHNVQDKSANYTRFICISKQLEVYQAGNKISVMTGLPHRAGSLNNMLGRFAALGLNLTKLESRPGEKPFEFTFYFDFDGNVFDPRIVTLIAQMQNQSDNFAFLGCYSEL